MDTSQSTLSSSLSNSLSSSTTTHTTMSTNGKVYIFSDKASREESQEIRKVVQDAGTNIEICEIKVEYKPYLREAMHKFASHVVPCPFAFFNEQPIGGLKDVERLKNQNRLVELLEQTKTMIDSPALSQLFKNQTDLFELKPDTMYFPPPLNRSITCVVQISNRTEMHTVFKIKTTAPKRYIVKPKMGFLAPFASAKVEVLLQQKGEKPEEDDRFRLEGVLLSTYSPEFKPEEIFDKSTSKHIIKHKLECAFTNPPENFRVTPIGNDGILVQQVSDFTAAARPNILKETQMYLDSSNPSSLSTSPMKKSMMPQNSSPETFGSPPKPSSNLITNDTLFNRPTSTSFEQKSPITTTMEQKFSPPTPTASSPIGSAFVTPSKPISSTQVPPPSATITTTTFTSEKEVSPQSPITTANTAVVSSPTVTTNTTTVPAVVVPSHAVESVVKVDTPVQTSLPSSPQVQLEQAKSSSNALIPVAATTEEVKPVISAPKQEEQPEQKQTVVTPKEESKSTSGVETPIVVGPQETPKQQQEEKPKTPVVAPVIEKPVTPIIKEQLTTSAPVVSSSVSKSPLEELSEQTKQFVEERAKTVQKTKEAFEQAEQEQIKNLQQKLESAVREVEKLKTQNAELNKKMKREAEEYHEKINVQQTKLKELEEQCKQQVAKLSRTTTTTSTAGTSIMEQQGFNITFVIVVALLFFVIGKLL